LKGYEEKLKELTVEREGDGGWKEFFAEMNPVPVAS
jgi:hypothetical protein